MPVRLLLGHRLDPTHVDYFPAAAELDERFGVHSDPAYLLVSPDGRVLFKAVGKLGKTALLAGLATSRK